MRNKKLRKNFTGGSHGIQNDVGGHLSMMIVSGKCSILISKLIILLLTLNFQLELIHLIRILRRQSSICTLKGSRDLIGSSAGDWHTFIWQWLTWSPKTYSSDIATCEALQCHQSPPYQEGLHRMGCPKLRQKRKLLFCEDITSGVFMLFK